jgi:hypothetical protein
MEKDAKKRVDEATKVIVALNTPLGWDHSCPQKLMMLTFSILFLSFIFPLFLFRFFFPFCPLSLSFSLFLCSSFLSSWFLWSASSFGFCWTSQHHGQVFPLLPLLWQKLSMLVNFWHWPPPTAESWWIQQWCYCGWSIPFMLLLKVPEHVCDCCCCLKWFSISVFETFCLCPLGVSFFFLFVNICPYYQVISQFCSFWIDCAWRGSYYIWRHFSRIHTFKPFFFPVKCCILCYI